MHADDASLTILREWNENLIPLRIDLVGDFAGKSLLAIHGESLLPHCVTEANVDLTDGFQLLHAVQAFETFLCKLKQRGCIFHVLWFDNHQELALPLQADKKHSYKFLLTRAALIERLRSPKGRCNPLLDDSSKEAGTRAPMSFVFPAIGSETFTRYTRNHCLQLVMCSRSGLTKSHLDDNPQDISRLVPNFLFASEGFSLAFVDDVEFRSSKIYAHVVNSPKFAVPSEISEAIVRPAQCINDEDVSSLIDQWAMRQGDPRSLAGLDVRQDIALGACVSILKANPGDATERRVAAFLVHTAMLEGGDLAQRSFGQFPRELDGEDEQFLEGISNVAIALIRRWTHSRLGTNANLQVYDLVDGRLFMHVLQSLDSINLIVDVRANGRVIEGLVGADVLRHLPDHGLPTNDTICVQSIAQKRVNLAVLPFTHPNLDPFLEEVKIRTDQQKYDATNSKVFRELIHWHNARKAVDPKHTPKPTAWWTRKKNQRLMTNIRDYALSLSGKNIDRETIVAQGPQGDGRDGDKVKKANLRHKKGDVVPGKTEIVAISRSTPKSGTMKALETAQTFKAMQEEDRNLNASNGLLQRCRSLDQVESTVKRYLEAKRYLEDRPVAEKCTIGGELSLYICQTLAASLGDSLTRERGLGIIGLIYSHVVEMCKFQLTVETVRCLKQLASVLHLPLPPMNCHISNKRALPFSYKSPNQKSLAGLSADNTDRQFLLEHCGPYLERSFESAPDPRVSFQPDAWQRRVLDAIDEDKSLFVVAPTSAGKTFISFYAMRKILQGSDDGVLVYVAPTKALVNQIAAEIQARFSKKYSNGGRSVWAVHTRDYRINDPSGCQILVTVPHILQIMLLAPFNAHKARPWSLRVKRIIFDEVHCIGQAEDGIIWEQLLLLAPCPLIALSATVGNPDQFKDWLGAVQKSKGFELEMVVHSSRYSDLRKFIYQPPALGSFEGFQPIERLPVPGLDADDCNSDRFVFVHPVGSIVNKSNTTLEDISLEPRDCFRLWQVMNKHKTDTYPLNRKLDPDFALPEVMRKSDVSKWEVDLKCQLSQWMMDADSPFDKVRRDLAVNASPSIERMIESTFDLLHDLRSRGALPAILFNYSRDDCEKILFCVLGRLESAEQTYRETSPEWKRKMNRYELREAQKAKKQAKIPKVSVARRGERDDGEVPGKLDVLRENADQEASGLGLNFDPDWPNDQYSFADPTRCSREELSKMTESLTFFDIKEPLINALRRGLGVHHAGMNRQYRQVVEILFRRGFLTVVVATGTLALGINMPCKTVVFAGDSVYLSALNYRQASGRAGRRGFDVLGNVVFHGISHHRVMEIMSSRLPDLKGQFPMSVALILRLFVLLYGTGGSDYAVKAFRSLLTQTRLFLGGPSSQMIIKHHLRFSIEYLQRQHLLSASGAPLNFSGLIGHLYFTENAVFAFHSLLKEGYLHELCEDIDNSSKQKDIIIQLLTVLCHLFRRFPCPRYMTEERHQDVIRRSPSIVFLPRLPQEAERILRNHNRETLNIFQGYVQTFVEQHLSDTPDDTLPFTKCCVRPRQDKMVDLSASNLPILPPVMVRSPFAALSGHTDDFETIHELCETVRGGVFLEEQSIPYIPIYPDETNGVPFNAYILDFFKHGDVKALARDNGIRRGEIWFHLKDFSLILATIVTSLTNFLNGNGAMFDDTAMLDVQDVGDVIQEGSADDEPDDAEMSAMAAATSRPSTTPAPKTNGKAAKAKKEVLESWEDDTDGDDENSKSSNASGSDDSSSSNPTDWNPNMGGGLLTVLKAFRILQAEFDEKFRAMWA